MDINPSTKNILKFGLIIFAVIILGFSGGYYYAKRSSTKNLTSLTPIRETDAGYKFIKPLLAFDYPAAEDAKFNNLKIKLKNLISREELNKKATKISVYFQALDKARWVGIDEDEKYDPASLLKVVIMMAYFKKSEQDPAILSKNLSYGRNIANLNNADEYDAPSGLKIGENYTVDDLIKKMIIDSDNGAKNLLLVNIDDASVLAVYDSLGLPKPNGVDNFETSPRVYSYLFRVLYNATYLRRKLSEKALALLAETTFNKGLAAGIPKDMTIADKFGKYIDHNTDGNIINMELHDCGIVYYSSPYFLCVMTKGSNQNSLEGTIKDISTMVYQEFSKIN